MMNINVSYIHIHLPYSSCNQCDMRRMWYARFGRAFIHSFFSHCFIYCIDQGSNKGFKEEIFVFMFYPTLSFQMNTYEVLYTSSPSSLSFNMNVKSIYRLRLLNFGDKRVVRKIQKCVGDEQHWTFTSPCAPAADNSDVCIVPRLFTIQNSGIES